MTKLLDFKNNPVEVLTLDELKETAKELNYNDEPMMGIHHYEMFDKTIEIIDKHNLDFKVSEIFAASNNDRSRPGVSLIKRVAEEKGQGSLEAHMLRRVIGKIDLTNFNNDEMVPSIGISFHQNGMQFSLGHNVHICQNMCILGSQNIIANYSFNGNEKVPLENMFEIVDDWMFNVHEKIEHDKEIIEWMKNTEVLRPQILEFIGKLMELRIARDKFKSNKMIPLNQSQIGQFTTNWLKEEKEHESDSDFDGFKLWDLYNMGTELHKPGITDFPNILPANYKFGSLVKGFFNYN